MQKQLNLNAGDKKVRALACSCNPPAEKPYARKVFTTLLIRVSRIIYNSFINYVAKLWAI